MSNPTSNFGWQMPTATDLVTDLPADFEVFGQAVDTDLADLNGGTTGQILSKTSATDLDFTWIDANAGDITGVTAGTGISGGGTSGTVTVTNSMATAIDAKGDLIAGTGADTFAKLTVGANGTTLVADSSEATGLKWQAATSSSPASEAARVETEQGTTSSSFTDLATAGPAVTLTTGTKVLVIVTAEMMNSSAVESNLASFAVSGATTIAAGTYDWYVRSMIGTANERVRFSAASRFAGYTAGSNTFTMKYRRTGGTAYFGLREIIVMDLGS